MERSVSYIRTCAPRRVSALTPRLLARSQVPRRKVGWEAASKKIGHFLLLVVCGTFSCATGQGSCCAADGGLDCSSSSVQHLGQRYYCMNLESPEVDRACVQCLPATGGGGGSAGTCLSCCGTPNTECDLDWSWGAVLATLSVSAVFATCSGILALTEKRRKRKGMSLARAWSIPHGMPMLRATVVDLSDAVRGRGSASIWRAGGSNVEGASDEDLLEHVGLLEEITDDSIYGALVEQHEVPVAKLAEDNWVTAMAWRQRVDVGEQGREVSADDGAAERWRSARAMARQARRANNGNGAGAGAGAGVAVSGAAAPLRNLSAAAAAAPTVEFNFGRSRSQATGGGGGSRWEPPPAVVLNGNERWEVEEVEEQGEEDRGRE